MMRMNTAMSSTQTVEICMAWDLIGISVFEFWRSKTHRRSIIVVQRYKWNLVTHYAHSIWMFFIENTCGINNRKRKLFNLTTFYWFLLLQWIGWKTIKFIWIYTRNYPKAMLLGSKNSWARALLVSMLQLLLLLFLVFFSIASIILSVQASTTSLFSTAFCAVAFSIFFVLPSIESITSTALHFMSFLLIISQIGNLPFLHIFLNP